MAKEIKKCKNCAWAKLPSFMGMVKCQLKDVDVWEESVACAEASEVHVKQLWQNSSHTSLSQ